MGLKNGDLATPHAASNTMDVGELEELRANLTTDLYEEFIPFWSDSGAIDADHGGVMCEVAHDGSVKGTSKKYGYLLVCPSMRTLLHIPYFHHVRSMFPLPHTSHISPHTIFHHCTTTCTV